MSPTIADHRREHFAGILEPPGTVRCRTAAEGLGERGQSSGLVKPTDVKAMLMFRSADILPNDRVVFNIGGNKYQLVVAVHYRGRRVFIRFIGTHAEYDKVDAATI